MLDPGQRYSKHDSLCRRLKLLDRTLHLSGHHLDVVVDPVQQSTLIDDEV